MLAMLNETSNAQAVNFGPAFLEQFNSCVIYEDDSVMAINKPAGVPVYGACSTSTFGVAEAVLKTAGPDINAVHRLDRDTSGLLLLGKKRANRRNLSNQFAKRTVRKTYLALVDGEWVEKIAGIIAPLTSSEPVRVDLYDRVKKAATGFSQIALFEDSNGKLKSLLKVRLYTGRTHQIRAHLAFLNNPIVGDKIYNEETPDGFERQLLHAYQLTFNHPSTRNEQTLKAPIPNDFLSYVSNLRGLKITESLEAIIGR
jgi:23S rRNA pseudouridine955/2504/2580 synthase